MPVLTVREPGKKLRLAVLDLDYHISMNERKFWMAITKPQKAYKKRH